MELSERLLEVLRALFWNLGTNLTEKIPIDWDILNEGKLQNGRSADGHPLFIDLTPETLKELASLNLIETEQKSGPSLKSSIGVRSHSIVRLLPKALEIEGLLNNAANDSQDSARYARVLIDIHKFSEMIEEYFNIEEQPDLCLGLGLDFQSIVPANATKLGSAQAIVTHMRRKSRLMELWCACNQQRPKSDWVSLFRG